MKRITKRFLCGLLCLVLAASCLFTGCRQTEAPETTVPPTTAHAEPVLHTVTVKDTDGEVYAGLGVYIYTDNTKSELVWFAKTNDQGVITFTDVLSDSYVAVLAEVPQGCEAEAMYPLTGTQTEIVLEVTAISQDDLENVNLGLGDMMFDFTVTDIEGTEYSLAKLLQEKDAVVLNFWFLECQPCMAEFPHLQEAYMDYSDRVAVLAVNPVNPDAAALQQMKEEKNLTFPVIQVPETWAKALGVTAYPTTVVIDRFGKITLRHTGSVPYAAGFRAVFDTFVGEDYVSTVVEDPLPLVNAEDTKGTKDDPYVFGGVTSFEVTVKPGETVYVHLYKAFDMYLKIQDSSAYIIKGNKTYENEGGKVSLTVNCEDSYTPLELQIGNTSDEIKTFKADLSAKSGTVSNPKKFQLGELTVSVSAGNEQGVYYQFKAPEDGILTVECLGGTEGVEYNFALYNLNSYSYRTLKDDGEGNTLSVKVKKGQQIQFIMFTVPDEDFKYPAGTFQLNVTLGEDTGEEEEEEVKKGTYTVTVKDSEGNPMPGIVMKVEGTDHSSVMTTDEAGVASAELALGAYTVTVTVPADYTAETPVLELTEEAPAAELVLTQVTATYTEYKVTVLAPDGVTPVENALVIIGSAMANTDVTGAAAATLETGDHPVYISNLDPMYATYQSYYTFPEGSSELTVILIYTPGTENNPISIDTNPFTTRKIAAGEMVHYRVYDMGGKILEIQDGSAFVIYKGVTYGVNRAGAIRILLEDESPAALILGTTGTEKVAFTLHFLDAAQPEEPSTDPTEDTTAPTEDTTDPTEDTTDPTEETTDPTEDTTVPEEPEETEPTEPTEPEGEAEYTVTVTDYAGNAAAGITVAVYDENANLVKTGLTDAEGKAVLEMDRGHYTVRLLATAAYYEQSTAILTPADTALTVLLAAEPDTETTEELWICDNGSAYHVGVGGTHVKIGGGQFGYSTEKDVTFFAFAPAEAGIYRITASNPAAQVSYWGGTFFPNESTPDDYADNAFTVTVQEGNLGSVMALGVRGSGECALIITRLGDPGFDPNYMPFEPYAYKITPEAFTYTGEALTDVDLSGVEITLVFSDEDGLYHVGSVDGPVLYVNLVSGRIISLYNMVNGQGNIGAQPFRAAFYNSKGEYIKEDYTELMQQYTACADKKTGVYPVNEELMYILRKGIEFNGWGDPENPNYLFKDESGNLMENIHADYAWMFLFCYEQVQ